MNPLKDLQDRLDCLETVFNTPKLLEQLKRLTDSNLLELEVKSSSKALPREIVITLLTLHSNSYNMPREILKLSTKYFSNWSWYTFRMTDRSLLPYLSESYKWLPTRLLTLLREERLTKEFDASKKNIVLNDFSYILFEKYLQTRKPLSGKDVCKYIEQTLDKNGDEGITSKYIWLLWNNCTRSKEVIKLIINNRHRIKPSPIQLIQDLISEELPIDSVLYLNNWSYYTIAKLVGIPIPSDYNRETNNYTTGIISKRELSNENKQITIEKIVMLSMYKEITTMNKQVVQNHIDTMVNHLTNCSTELTHAIAKTKSALQVLTNIKLPKEIK